MINGKLTLHTETKNSGYPDHNDREMYSRGYEVTKEIEDRRKFLESKGFFKSKRYLDSNYKIYEGLTNKECEDKFFEDNHRSTLEARNEKYRKKGNHHKVQDMQKYMANNICEDIVSFGNIDSVKSHYDYYLFATATAKATQQRITQLKNMGVTVLSSNLHVDEEGVAHSHIRYVFYDFEKHKCDKSGILKNAGFTNSKNKKRDNKVVDFTKATRELLADSIESITYKDGERVFSVDREPYPNKRGHKSVAEFKRDKIAEQESIIEGLKALESDFDILAKENIIRELRMASERQEMRNNDIEEQIKAEQEKYKKLIDNQAKLESALSSALKENELLNSKVQGLHSKVDTVEISNAELINSVNEMAAKLSKVPARKLSIMVGEDVVNHYRPFISKWKTNIKVIEEGCRIWDKKHPGIDYEKYMQNKDKQRHANNDIEVTVDIENEHSLEV